MGPRRAQARVRTHARISVARLCVAPTEYPRRADPDWCAGAVPGIALQKKCYGCFRIPALARNPLTGQFTRPMPAF